MAGILSGNQALLDLFLDLFKSGYERLTRWLTYRLARETGFRKGRERGSRYCGITRSPPHLPSCAHGVATRKPGTPDLKLPTVSLSLALPIKRIKPWILDQKD